MILLFGCPVVSDSLGPHGLQHTRLPCPSPSPEVCPSSCPLHQWCHPAVSSSDALFSFCPQSFPTSGTFPMSWLFASGDQNTRVSASAISPSNEYSGLISLNIDWFDLPAVQGLSGVFSRTTVQKHQFSGFLPSFWSSSHNHTWPLGRPQPWLYEHL